MTGGSQWSLADLARPPLPVNIHAEQALLGAIFANNQAYERVAAFLRAEHFADPIHSRIYAEIERRIQAGQLADAVTLKTAFENSGVLTEVGGTAYLAQLLAAMVGILNAGEYGRSVHECWLRREMIDAGVQMVDAAYGGQVECDAADLLSAAQDRISAIAEDTAPVAGRRGTTTLAQAVEAVRDRAEAIHRGDELPGLETGLRSVDDAYGRFLAPATLTYLAGLGEVGKTTLALQIAENVAVAAWQQWSVRREGPCPGVLFFSFDMTAEQLGRRSAARLGGISARKLRAGKLDDDVCRGLIAAQSLADQTPLEIDDGEPPNLARVLGGMRRFERRRPLVLTVVDNLSKLVGEAKASDALLSLFLATTNALKKQANRRGSPILLLLHLPQTVAKRDNPMPRRGDLPYGIHLHADTALALWRPELALPAKPPEQGRMKDEAHAKLVDQWHKDRDRLRNVAELVPLKLREDDGDSGVVRLRYDHAISGFVDPRAVVDQPEMPE